MKAAAGDIPEWVPLFPLPETVLFPRQLLPLHIFEPRYRTMIRDVMAADRCIAVALLRPGYEPRYFTHRAPIHRVVGVGRVVAVEQLGDGKCNILLRGEARAVRVAEQHDRPYRLAAVKVLHSYCNHSAAAQARLRRALIERIETFEPLYRLMCTHCREMLQTPVSLGTLADLVAGCLPGATRQRQALLEETDVARRAVLLCRLISRLAARQVGGHTARPAGWQLN